jgi:cell shape-determining protein MreC
MDDTTREDLARLDEIHQQITRLQEEENALAAKLGTSNARGVRTAMARILGVSVEALRLRYGAVQSVADAGQGGS